MRLICGAVRLPPPRGSVGRGSRAATRKSRRRLRRPPGTVSKQRGWRARLPQRRTWSRDPLGEKSRGLAQDQVLVFEPLHLALEAQHLGFIRFLLGQRLSRASGQLLIAPLAQLARTDIQLRSDVGEWQATLDQALNRLGLILAGEPPPGSFLCHSILLGCLGSLQNPPLHRGKPTRLCSEQDFIGQRVVEAHQSLDEWPDLNAQRFSPCAISIRGNAAAASLELRDERIVFGTDQRRELPLREAARLSQLFQEPPAFSTQPLDFLRIQALAMSIHGEGAFLRALNALFWPVQRTTYRPAHRAMSRSIPRCNTPLR